MAKVVNGSKVIYTIDVADIRRAYSQMSLNKLKAMLFSIGRRPS